KGKGGYWEGNRGFPSQRLLRRDRQRVDEELGVVHGALEVGRRDEHLRRLDEREVRAPLVQLLLDRLVERLALRRVGRDQRGRRELLDRRIGALRPPGTEPDEVPRRERQVVGRIRIVGPPQREAERHLAAAVVREPRARRRARERHVDARLLQVRLHLLGERRER